MTKSPFDVTREPVSPNGKLSLFRADENGAMAVEYVLIAGLITLAIVTAIGAIGSQLNSDVFGALSEAFNAALG